MDPVQFIRTKSREQWETFALSKVAELRAWVQERGEVALIGGLVLGIFLVLLFKLLVGLFVFALLGAFLVWHIALPEVDSPDGANFDNKNPNKSE